METFVQALSSAGNLVPFLAAFALSAFVSSRIARSGFLGLKKEEHHLSEERENRLVGTQRIRQRVNTAKFEGSVSFAEQELDLRREGTELVDYFAGLVDGPLADQIDVHVNAVNPYFRSRGATDQTFWEMMDPQARIVVNPVPKKGVRGLPGYEPPISEQEAKSHVRELEGIRRDLWAIERSTERSYRHDEVSRDVSVIGSLKEGKAFSGAPELGFNRWVDDIFAFYPKNEKDLAERNGLKEAVYVMEVLRDNGHKSKLPKKKLQEAMNTAEKYGREDEEARRRKGISAPTGPAPRTYLR